MSTSTQSAGSCLRIGLAVLVGIGFVVITVAALVMLPAVFQLFNPATYKNALRAEQTYDRLPVLMAEMAADSPSASDPDNVMRYLDQQDYELIFSQVLTPEWSQAQVEGLIDQEFAYLNSDTPTLVLNVSLVELKQTLGGRGGDEIMAEIIRSWPACTPAEEQAWAAAAAPGAQFNPPECRPSDAALSSATPRLGEVFSEMVADMPDTVDLAAPSPSATPAATTQSSDPRPAIQLIKILTYISPVISLILLGLVGLLAVRSWGSLFGWTGALLLISGIGGFLIALSLGLIVEVLVSGTVDQVMTQGEAGAELFEIVLEVFRNVLRGVGLWAAVLSALTGFIGLVALIVAFITRRKGPVSTLSQPPAYG